jgi:hypothetical protein
MRGCVLVAVISVHHSVESVPQGITAIRSANLASVAVSARHPMFVTSALAIVNVEATSEARTAISATTGTIRFRLVHIVIAMLRGPSPKCVTRTTANVCVNLGMVVRGATSVSPATPDFPIASRVTARQSVAITQSAMPAGGVRVRTASAGNNVTNALLVITSILIVLTVIVILWVHLESHVTMMALVFANRTLTVKSVPIVKKDFIIILIAKNVRIIRPA